MLRDKLLNMPCRIKIDYRGCGDQRFADQRRIESRFGLQILGARMGGMDSNCTVEIQDAETGEHAVVNGYHPPFELYIYPGQIVECEGAPC